MIYQDTGEGSKAMQNIQKRFFVVVVVILVTSQLLNKSLYDYVVLVLEAITKVHTRKKKNRGCSHIYLEKYQPYLYGESTKYESLLTKTSFQRCSS